MIALTLEKHTLRVWVNIKEKHSLESALNFECIYSGFNQTSQQERSIIGGLCNLFTLGIINTDGALSGVYVCYTNRSLWNGSFCYDVFDLEQEALWYYWFTC